MLELSPRDVDRHSFRDLRVMMEGAEEREKEKWRPILYQMQDLRTVIGGDKKPIDYLFKQMFGSHRRQTRWSSKKEYSAWLRDADRRVKEKNNGRRK